MTPANEGPDGRAGIDAGLVRRLLAAQFPRWAGLAVRPVAVDGWDNRTYRLGEDMTVRLPTAAGYVPAVAKENAWLPVLAPHLPVPVPEVLGRGEPGEGYPYPWSVRRWLAGETATTPERVGGPAELAQFAEDLGRFVLALRVVDPTGGPVAGAHSWQRGAPPVYYDEETRGALTALEGSGLVDTAAAAEVWQAALDAPYEGPPVWFHGDIAGGNLLVRGGRLAAVLDFGTSGVGDPACDLVVSWTLLSGESRAAFRRTVGGDAGMWARARGWALWKALICVVRFRASDPALAAEHARVAAEVLADHTEFAEPAESRPHHPYDARSVTLMTRTAPAPSDDWERRDAEVWATIGTRPDDEFRAAVEELIGELPEGDPTGVFERAAAWDSTGHSDKAVPLYRAAIDAGVPGERHRRAVIQMASSLRNLGRSEESVALLTKERERTSDHLDDAVVVVLALALTDVGRAREAVSLSVAALAPHLPRYQRSMANYARLLVENDESPAR